MLARAIDNAHVAGLLEEMATRMPAERDDWRRAARFVKKLDEPIEELCERCSVTTIRDMAYLPDDVASAVVEAGTTGRLVSLESKGVR